MAGRLGGWAVTVACFVLRKYIREHASTASAKAAVAKQMAEPWRKCNINRAKTRRWPVPHLKIEKENTRLGKVRRHRINATVSFEIIGIQKLPRPYLRVISTVITGKRRECRGFRVEKMVPLRQHARTELMPKLGPPP